MSERMLEQGQKNYQRLIDVANDEQKIVFEENSEILKNVFGLSNFISNVFIHKPVLGFEILSCKAIDTKFKSGIYKEQLHSLLSKIKDDTILKRELRNYRNKQMAIIAWRELLAKSSIEESFEALSELAEVFITETLDYLYNLNCGLYGTPTSHSGEQQKMLVIGMGKLGGKELNFSSDIDLIFCYPRSGETVGSRRAIDNQVFFTRLGQQLIQALDQKTADGQVYRVDMRLRPFGESGPLVSSFAALEDYYLKHGRSWERYAMVKGRILGETNIFSQELEEMLRPFVFRRYLDFGAIESLRKMKSMIEAEVRRRQLHGNFKLGEGGIREIEFIAQVFQLMRGGRIKALQEKHLLTVLDNLKNCGCIDEKAYSILMPCYVFLRHTENILQEINDEQTQTLPDKLLDQDRLFTAMGFDSYESFLAKINDIMSKVHAEFAMIISDPDTQEVNKEDPVFLDLWLLHLNSNEVLEILNNHFQKSDDLEELAQAIVLFNKECMSKPIGPRGREILNKLMPYLFSKLSSITGAAKIFNRIAQLILRIVSRTTYLQLMIENPGVCDQLIKLCAGSRLITEQLTEHPILLDELLMPQNLYTPTDPKDYPHELREFLLRVENNDLEQQMESLRQFKQIQLLRICAADLVGALPLMKVSDYLTFLAQTILAEVVNLTWNQLVSKYGEPSNARLHGDHGICVIAYGKMGGIELGYGSDLDLVFLCDGELTGDTNGENSISDAMFYGRFAQRLMHLFSTRLSSGILYEVDTRLRPEGDAGPLICSLSGYSSYLENKAWTWELQALVRARAVLGPERLVNEFNNVRNRIIRKQRDELFLCNEVVSMRKKMRDSLIQGKKDEFDIKQGFGGMTDIEFMAQYLVLVNAQKYQSMVLWSDNVRIFEECARLKLIPPTIANRLIDAYLAIRNKYHKNSLQGISRVVTTSELDKERLFVQTVWNALMINHTNLSDII